MALGIMKIVDWFLTLLMMSLLVIYLCGRYPSDGKLVQYKTGTPGRRGGRLCKQDDVTYIILFTYMRSGSSFTGEMFKKNPKAFYLYEPFYSILEEMTMGLRDPERNGRHSKVLEELLACRYTDPLTINAMSNNMLLIKRLPEIKDSFWCNKHVHKEGPDHDKNKKLCLAALTRRCKEHKIRATKIIRASMEEIALLLNANQHCAERIKIIHLLRDPRGLLNSFLHLRPNTAKDKLAASKDNLPTERSPEGFCPRMLQDLHIRKELEEKYPKSFLEVCYSDMANMPMEIVTRIYKFALNRPAPKEVYEWYDMATENENSHEDKWKTVRKNSSKTAQSWKSALPTDLIKDVQNTCHDLIQYMQLEFLN